MDSLMAENPRDFAPHFFLRPVGVPRMKPRRFHFARRPAKLFRQRQTAFRRHAAINHKLFGTGLLIWQHEKRKLQKVGSRKRRTSASWIQPFFLYICSGVSSCASVVLNVSPWPSMERKKQEL
jgi:hypothetical protein